MRVIITGAASGIGKACIDAISDMAHENDRPARFLLVDQSAAPLRTLSTHKRNSEDQILTLAGDLSEVAMAEQIASIARQEWGGIDSIVSNAGVIMTAPLQDMSIVDYQRMFDVNTRPTWLLAKACYRMLQVSEEASIVATASISASQPTPPHGAYSPSKAALAMLIRQMANEWGPDGIRCNCVSPGMIHTGMTDSVYSDDVKRAERARHIPLRRVGLPQDVARVVAFLLSPAAAYITGVDLAVDGGVQTGLMPTLRGAAVPQ